MLQNEDFAAAFIPKMLPIPCGLRGCRIEKKRGGGEKKNEGFMMIGEKRREKK